jgi:hypothetical protein
MRESHTKLLRFVVALTAGPFLSVGFVYLFSRVDSHACEAMFEFVARIFGLGFEASGVTLLITMTAIAATFSILCWIVLRTWGPLR